MPSSSGWRSQDESPLHRSPQVIDGLLVGLLRGDAVFPFRAVHENIPGEPVHLDATMVRVLHHAAPEADLLIDGHLLDDLEFRHHHRTEHIIAAGGEGVVKGNGGALDVLQRDVGILGDLHDGREGMQVPEGQDVEAMPRHFIQKLAPEVEAPHFADVLLRGVAVVGVTGGADVQRDVELDASAVDMGRVVGIGGRGERSQADGLGEVEAAVHGARRVAAQDDEGCAVLADGITFAVCRPWAEPRPA